MPVHLDIKSSLGKLRIPTFGHTVSKELSRWRMELFSRMR